MRQQESEQLGKRKIGIVGERGQAFVRNIEKEKAEARSGRERDPGKMEKEEI